ncbi:hypothetical protein CEXT_96411 [Caerostris extrusa]|uniref:Uncharacterized protein n=1 Tax=Caerostris extrusa TaxID=172846 RepID=A0AAV4VSX1_CAEEX|nr:hypothetical protein CEXT_96411 [Caerostris extrusa]
MSRFYKIDCILFRLTPVLVVFIKSLSRRQGRPVGYHYRKSPREMLQTRCFNPNNLRSKCLDIIPTNNSANILLIAEAGLMQHKRWCTDALTEYQEVRS